MASPWGKLVISLQSYRVKIDTQKLSGLPKVSKIALKYRNRIFRKKEFQLSLLGYAVILENASLDISPEV